MWISQVINGIMLPFVLFFMLMLINKKEIMGDYVNRGTFNTIAWATVIIMCVLTVMSVVSMFM
jgi:Mn2+/Fe2+ NRAMP family transporter